VARVNQQKKCTFRFINSVCVVNNILNVSRNTTEYILKKILACLKKTKN